MSRVASANRFDVLGDDEDQQEVAPAPAPAKPQAGGKKPAAAAAPAPAQPAPVQQNKPRSPRLEAANDNSAEDGAFNRGPRGPRTDNRRPPREDGKNDRHLSRNGMGRETSKGGGGRGNWGNGLDENRPRGPNSKKIPEEPAAVDSEASPEAAAADAAGEPAADASADAAAAPAEPEEPKKEDPADKFIDLDEFLAQKEAKRVAEDRNIKIREVVVDDKTFKTIKVAVSDKDIIENDFSDLKVAKKGKKEKAANKRAQSEAIDLYPVGAPQPPRGPPAGTEGGFRGSPRGDSAPRGRGGFRGRGGGSFRGRGPQLRPEDFPSLVVGAPVQ